MTVLGLLLIGFAALSLRALSHVFTLTFARGSENISKQVTVANEGEDNRDITVPGSTTNMQVDLAFAIARLKSIYILTDQVVTLKTNSTGSPGDTIVFAANIPFLWIAGSGIPCPFTADVTTTYWTRGTTGAATLQIRPCLDATP